ncbi:hypothetical protein [Pseudogulbenkiania sp. MAI-1]|uniref:hypothetical protein n=1 Tax=Pseudogulbenkiania sp. MAI-1 TaxID=990370 RepID=UPI00045E5C4B|nr:hypothetical protein [Pseudogulbenkiania sp. MAI-1]
MNLVTEEGAQSTEHIGNRIAESDWELLPTSATLRQLDDGAHAMLESFLKSHEFCGETASQSI